jgi:hypothetical protein
MIQAKDLQLDLNDSGIFFTGTYQPGQKIQRDIVNGDNATLKKDEIDIEVQNLKRNLDGTYTGVVQYVDPYQALSKEGVEEGVEIGFMHKHIFASSHR